jgi:hypothetical protein
VDPRRLPVVRQMLWLKLLIYQHGFRKERSCESQLLLTIQDLADGLNNTEQIDCILLDVSKAFDKVPCGTPDVMAEVVDFSPFSRTRCGRPDRKLVIHCKFFP